LIAIRLANDRDICSSVNFASRIARSRNCMSATRQARLGAAVSGPLGVGKHRLAFLAFGGEPNKALQGSALGGELFDGGLDSSKRRIEVCADALHDPDDRDRNAPAIQTVFDCRRIRVKAR
jgi:hypothetical protein